MNENRQPPAQSSIFNLQSSIQFCRRLTRGSRSSFRFSFDLLPAAKADAMHALYAFLRETDDLTDEPGDEATKRCALTHWRCRLDAALAGTPSHRCHTAIAHTVRTFGIPPAYLHAVLDGCETDLGPVRFDSFDPLRVYCYRVASVVGLSCVRIWGLKPGATFEQVEPLAEAAGYAFQLTNVLRDLGEDLERGRVYLPADELARFDCPPEKWGEAANTDRFRELVKFQVARTSAYYQQSEPLAELLTPEGRNVFTLMSRAYRGLLDRVDAAGAGILTRRVRLRWWRKLELASRAWAHTWIG